MRRIALSLVLFTSVPLLVRLAAEDIPRSGLSVRETRYLFLDMAEVERMDGLVQAINLGEKHPNNPVLEGTPGEWDHPRIKFYGTVIFEPESGMWKMWYSGTEDQPAGLAMTALTDTRHIGYAVSRDGVHWEKPKLGIVDYHGSKQNNLVLLDGQAANVFDLRGILPGKRYRMYTESFGHGGGINFRWLRSDDGLHWEDEGRISAKDLPIELANVIYDADDPNPNRRWKAYLLMMDISDFPTRKLGVVTSPDGEKWSQPTIVLDPRDGLEDEDHYLGVTKYHDYYIALYDFMYRNHSTQTELAVSRDGIRFQRVLNGHKVLKLGPKGAWDSSMPVIGQGFLTIAGKHLQYYTGSDRNYQEGSSRSGLGLPWRRQLGLATWRQDGFTDVRVADGAERGSLLTKPIRVGDQDLVVWVNTRLPAPGNALRVEILDTRTMRPLRGYEQSDSLAGIDHLEKVVEWSGVADLSKVGVPAIRLRFTLNGKEARLYAFGFRKKGAK